MPAAKTVTTVTTPGSPNRDLFENALDFDRCYRAVEARDARFDGWFITAVATTGIYCRPSCPTPIQPKRANVSFFPTTAAAQSAGYRACKRCRPDASPGSPEWDLRADLVGRAMRLIADGVVDRDGVSGLASKLHVSERHLGRTLQHEVGASPVALARAQRAQTARIFIETTELRLADVAFAAGFSSVRQFNETVKDVFALTPTELRRRATGSVDGAHARSGRVGLRLAFRRPYDAGAMFAWLLGHGPVGVVAETPTGLVRSLQLPNGHGVVELSSAEDHIWCTIELETFADLSVAVSRVRRMLDLDADPDTIRHHLGTTPLKPLVDLRPGLRVPGAVDGLEQAVLTTLGQQVSVKAGHTFGNRLIEQFGDLLAVPQQPQEPVASRRSPSSEASEPLVWKVFPSAEMLAEADLGHLGITTRRQRTIRALASACAEGLLDLTPGADRTETREALLGLPGIGPWTADIIAMRALGDPDVFPVGDLVLRNMADDDGLPDDPGELADVAEAWAPWRSYAAHQLWAQHSLPHSSLPKVSVSTTSVSTSKRANP